MISICGFEHDDGISLKRKKMNFVSTQPRMNVEPNSLQDFDLKKDAVQLSGIKSIMDDLRKPDHLQKQGRDLNELKTTRLISVNFQIPPQLDNSFWRDYIYGLTTVMTISSEEVHVWN